MVQSESMSAELLHILEHKRFKTSLADYGVVIEFVIPVLAASIAIFLMITHVGVVIYVVAALLIVASILLTAHMIKRFRQLNRFEAFTGKPTPEENENHCIDILRRSNVEQLDWDPEDFSISAKFRSSGLPRYEWLTIVFDGEKVLINSRPSPVSLITWWSRNAMQVFVKQLENNKS